MIRSGLYDRKKNRSCNELYRSFVEKGFWLKCTQFERLEVCAAKTPDKLAVTDDERSLTFRELTDRSSAYAAFFHSKGLKKGNVIKLTE